MKFAVIAHPPVVGGKVKSFDAADGAEGARRREGGRDPGRRRRRPSSQPLGGVAVVASNTWAAMQGRDALKIEWDDGPNATYDSVAYRAQLEETARKPGKVVRKQGDAEAALAAAAKVVDGRILHAASGARADGAAGRDRCGRRRQVRGLGARCRAPTARARTSPSCSACRSRTSRCTSRCSAAGSGASPSATSRRRRHCCPRRWAARR